MNKRVRLVLATLALAFGMLFVGHVALAAPSVDPTGSLNVEVINHLEKTVLASGTYNNATDWGSCLWWGDEQEGDQPTCFPTDRGDFSGITHQYDGYGVFTPTLTIVGPAGEISYMERVEFIQPEPLQPSGTLTVTVTDEERLQIKATGTYTNAVGDWNSCLTWGDGTEKCFPDNSGTIEEIHEFTEYGTFTVTLTVTGTEGTEPFSTAQVVKFEEPVPVGLNQIFLPLIVVAPKPEVKPSGTIEARVTNANIREVKISGTFHNTVDWGTCVNWGHQGAGEVCFPGIEGTFADVPHQFPNAGTFTITLMVKNPKGGESFETTVQVEVP